MRKICTILASALVVCCSGPEQAPIRYEMQGEGPIALVFVHDAGCEPGHWSSSVDHFSRGHAVVSLDHSVQSPAEVKHLIEQLELERVVLVGHANGGPVALQTARLIPERVLGIVGVETGHGAYDALIAKEAGPDEFNELLAEVIEELTGT